MPSNVRQLRGNPGRRTTEPRPQPVRGIPDPPSWLATEAKAEWKRVTPELNRLGLLAKIDRAVLAIYCDAWSKWVTASRRLESDGLTAKGARGHTMKSAVWQLYRDAGTQVAALAKELGLSPNARGRMKAPDPEPDDESDLD